MDQLLKLVKTKDIEGLELLKEDLKNQIKITSLGWTERAYLYKKIQFIIRCIKRLEGEYKMADDIKSLLQQIINNQKETHTKLDIIDLRLSSVENRTIVTETDISTIKENFTLLKNSINNISSRPLLDGQTRTT